MISKIMDTIEGEMNNFSIHKLIEAEQKNIYAAWTQAEQVKKWWGPRHFINPVCELDVRVGGRFRIEMTAPDGAVFPMSGIFHEIIPNAKLVFTTIAFEDENGNGPLEYLNTATFVKGKDATMVVVKAEIRKSVQNMECLMDGIKEGWKQSLDKLELLLQNQKQFKSSI